MLNETPTAPRCGVRFTNPGWNVCACGTPGIAGAFGTLLQIVADAQTDGTLVALKVCPARTAGGPTTTLATARVAGARWRPAETGQRSRPTGAASATRLVPEPTACLVVGCARSSTRTSGGSSRSRSAVTARKRGGRSNGRARLRRGAPRPGVAPPGRTPARRRDDLPRARHEGRRVRRLARDPVLRRRALRAPAAALPAGCTGPCPGRRARGALGHAARARGPAMDVLPDAGAARGLRRVQPHRGSPTSNAVRGP